MSQSARKIAWDWYPGSIPDNAIIGNDTYIETSFSFQLYRSELAIGLTLGCGSAIYQDTMLDVGFRGRVDIGDYVLLNGVRIICNAQIEIGSYTLLSWGIVLMDSYRVPSDPVERRQILRQLPQTKCRQLDADVKAQPICIQDNVWIGFDTCVLPGVTIGEGSIIGARSVVTEDVPPYTIVAENPARIIRPLEIGENYRSSS